MVPAPLVRETFDRADENPLNVATDGHQWTIHAGGAKVDGNKAMTVTGGVSATVDAGVRPGLIKSNINVVLHPTGLWVTGIQFRYVDENNRWFFVDYSGSHYLMKAVGGVVTNPAWQYLGNGAGDFEFIITDDGSQIKGYVNGSERVSVTDTDLASAHRCGLYVGHFYTDWGLCSWLDFEARG